MAITNSRKPISVTLLGGPLSDVPGNGVDAVSVRFSSQNITSLKIETIIFYEKLSAKLTRETATVRG